MAAKDKIKWDEKYKNTPSLLKDRDPSEKLKKAITYTKGLNALDIACGSGKNSIYLAKLGFNIDAFDISDVALSSLDKKGFKNIETNQIDLEGFVPKKEFYDLIVKTNYLDRDIIPSLINALKKDGVLFIETYMEDDYNEKPSSNPAFLLKKDELKTFINDKCKIIEYDEFDNESYELYRMKKQSIIIKKSK